MSHWRLLLLSLLCIPLLVSPALAADGPTPIKIRVAYPSGMNGQIPLVMEKAGIAAKHGLDLDLVFCQYGPPMMEALAAGHVDAVITSLMPVTTFLARDPGAAAIVANLGSSSYSLMVPKDSAATGIKDLRGKRIAVSYNSDSHLDLLRFIRSAGLDPKTDVRLLNVQPNELVLTLTQGFADAIVIRQPQVLKAQKQIGAKIIHTWPFRFVSIMRSDYLDKHPDVKSRYLAALRESIFYIAQNKEQASIWFGRQLRLDPEIVRRVSMDDPNYRAVRKLSDVSLDITPSFARILDNWFEASYEERMISTRIESGLPPQVSGR